MFIKYNHLLFTFAIIALRILATYWASSASPEPEDHINSGLLGQVVVCDCIALFKLFSREYDSLLIRGDSFFLINYLF